jgi:two-component system cell cycle sensor histidine kinase/response regulator CckA
MAAKHGKDAEGSKFVDNTKILIVEDERIVATDLRQRLVNQGYTVPTIVSSGEDALLKAAELRPHLVLMDIHLRGEMDGVETATQIRTQFDIPVVYLTASADETTLARARATGPFDYIVKPFEERDLQMAIEMALYKHQVERKVKESEARYRKLFDNTADPIISVSLDGTILQLNRAAEELLGWSRGDLVGQPYRKIVSPTSVALTEERTVRALTGEKLSPIHEVEFVRRDGSRVPMEVREQVLCDPEGKTLGFQGIFRDISGRKVLEQHRAEFLAMLTHDIRNPLMVILGYTELLLDETEAEDWDEIRDLLGKVQSNALTVHSLVDNYLEFSKVEAGHPNLPKKPLAINDVLQKVGRQYEAEARLRNLSLAVDLQEGLPYIEGNPLALERVFANLLYNAMKFTPAQGYITLRSARYNGTVIATVADTGPGIAREEIPLLFEKYRRVEKDKYRGGSGLGLFIVKELVDAHGGRIEVESTLGMGTCFSVLLPVGVSTPEDRVCPPGTAAPGPA